jgi:hypothetical protein
VERVADFLKRPRLVIAKPEALPHDLLLFPIEIADCARQVVEPALLDDRLVDRDLVRGERVAKLAGARVSPVESWLAERSVRARVPACQQLRRNENALIHPPSPASSLPDPPHRIIDELDVA